VIIVVAMKFATVILLPAVVSAALFDKRDAEPKLNKAAKRSIFRFGPLNLKPGVRLVLFEGSRY